MIFRKTTAGQAELRGRTAGLGPRERAVLILVNGELDQAVLAARLGFDVMEALAKLAARRLVERVPQPAAVARPAPIASPPAPPAAAPAQPFDLAAAQRRALDVLAPLFGPEAHDLAADLLRARQLKEFNAALRELGETLGMYQGRRHAAELIERIAGHD